MADEPQVPRQQLPRQQPVLGDEEPVPMEPEVVPVDQPQDAANVRPEPVADENLEVFITLALCIPREP